MAVHKAVQLERDNGLQDVYFDSDLYGDDVEFYVRAEADVVRDEYNSIKTFEATTPTTNTFSMKAFPVMENPNNFQVEKAGLREISQVVIYTPMKSWMAVYPGKTAEEIFTLIDMARMTVSLRGREYNIKDKTLHSQFADTFTYINFGLNEI